MNTSMSKLSSCGKPKREVLKINLIRRIKFDLVHYGMSMVIFHFTQSITCHELVEELGKY